LNVDIKLITTSEMYISYLIDHMDQEKAIKQIKTFYSI